MFVCFYLQQNKQLTQNEKDLKNYKEQLSQFEVSSLLLLSPGNIFGVIDTFERLWYEEKKIHRKPINNNCYSVDVATDIT